jgi:23S rRNA (guanosine2251-2'-O)-methyltransferase
LRKLKLEELNRLDAESYKETKKSPIIVVLDSIRSAMNVGSIFRSGDAFAIEEIWICGFTATPPHKEITKTAIGATESVAWKYIEDIKSAITQLKERGYKTVIIEQTDSSISLNDFQIDPDTQYALIMGNEVDGISDEILDQVDYAIDIPQYGTKHSLNVSVCAGIVIHHFSSFFKK